MEQNDSDNKEKWLTTFKRVTGVLPHPSNSHLSGLLPAQTLWLRETTNIREIYALTAARYNEYAPVHALPVEIISRIFEHVPDTKGITWSDTSLQYRRALVSIMRICRRWRDIALHTASLWARVSPNGCEPLDVFLQRSEGYPLYITGNIKLGDERHAQRIRQLLVPDHLLRLNTLHVYLEEDDTIAQLLSVEDAYAPQLKNIYLYAEWPPKAILSPTFLTSRAPRLRDLTLYGHFFPWGTGSSSLQCLDLSLEHFNDDLEPRFRRTFDDVLVSLAAMPNLERLKVFNALPELTVDKLQFVDTHKIVTMPRLRFLELNGDRGSHCVLWALLEVHPSADMEVTTYYASTDIMTRPLSQHTRRSDSSLYTSLTLCDDSSALSMQFTTSNELSHSKITFVIYTGGDISAPTALQVLCCTPLENLEALNVHDFFENVPIHHISTILSPAIRLRQLRLVGRAAVVLFSSLLLLPDVLYDECASPNVSIPLPGLVEIHIHGTDLTTTYDTTYEPNITGLVGECIGRALSFRLQAGHGLQHLVVTECKVEKEWVEYWKTVVGQVEWDGGASSSV